MVENHLKQNTGIWSLELKYFNRFSYLQNNMWYVMCSKEEYEEFILITRLGWRIISRIMDIIVYILAIILDDLIALGIVRFYSLEVIT